MPKDDDAYSETSDDELESETSFQAQRGPGFLIPPGHPQVISLDFNTLLSAGLLTPEVLENLAGLLAALQDSFRDAQPGWAVGTYLLPDCATHSPGAVCPPQCLDYSGCFTFGSTCPPRCIDNPAPICPPRCIDHPTPHCPPRQIQ
jgi:hypothetical protein